MRETSLSSSIGDALLLLHAGGLLALGVEVGELRRRVIVEQVDVTMGEVAVPGLHAAARDDDEAVGSKPIASRAPSAPAESNRGARSRPPRAMARR